MKKLLKIVVMLSIISVMTVSVMAQVGGDKTKSAERGIFEERTEEITITESNFRIKCLRENGILIGDENGDLQLESTLKRQEMVVLISRLMGKEEEAKAWDVSTLTFEDVAKENWAAPYIAWAKDNNITKGYSEEWFGYNDSLTKLQTEIFLVRVLGYTDMADENMAEMARVLSIVKDENEGLNEAIERAEVGEMLYNTLYANSDNREETIAEELEVVSEYTIEEATTIEYLEKYDVEIESIEKMDEEAGVIEITIFEEITEEMVKASLEEIRTITDIMGVKYLTIFNGEDSIEVILFEGYGIIATIQLNDEIIYDMREEENIEIN